MWKHPGAETARKEQCFWNKLFKPKDDDDDDDDDDKMIYAASSQAVEISCEKLFRWLSQILTAPIYSHWHLGPISLL